MIIIFECTTFLLEISVEWLDNINERIYEKGSVPFDLQKCVDTIEHKRVFKLSKYDVQGDEFKWFQNYVINRQQRIKVIKMSSKTQCGC